MPWPSEQIHQESRSWITSAGDTPIAPRRWGRWCARPSPAKTWRSTLGTPFISGKDSLNNEFSFDDAEGNRQTISIPPSLLISAMGQIEDVAKAVTMDAKKPGNVVFLVGRNEG